MKRPFTWSRLEDARRAFRKRYRRFWSLPLVRKSEDLVVAAAQGRTSVLDVGAGDGSLGERLVRENPNLRYTSVDPDPEREHDHRSLDEVTGTFEVVCCLEVIEHLEPAEAIDLLTAMRDRLGRGGVLVLSTPNVMNPTAFLTTVDHRTPWMWDELGGVMELLGYRVLRVVRVKNDPWLRRVGRRVMTPLHRALGIDFAVSIAVLAERAETSG